MPEAAYLHIPFCRRRCHYCDFPIAVLGQSVAAKVDIIDRYLEQLCQEIAMTVTTGRSLTTIFLGGGTPSLLSGPQLSRILQCLDQQFGIAAEAEISIEMDPGTFDLAKLRDYQAIGINRVSLGVQAFQDELLAHCGRSHSVADIFHSVKWIQAADIENFSLDLISGLPNQQLDQWHASLEQAIAFAPTHLSCYDLVLEPDTVFGQQYQPGEQPLPSEARAAQMYQLAQHILTQAGYEHYEISNYARPRYQCRHNRVYWENRSYYGFGMGATSYTDNQRFTRPPTLPQYSAWLNGQSHRPDSTSIASLDHNEQLLETLMLGLRLTEGISLSPLTHQFGAETVQTLWQSLQPYWQKGWIEAIAIDGQPIQGPKFPVLEQMTRLRLSDPDGLLVSNTILSTLFAALCVT